MDQLPAEQHQQAVPEDDLAVLVDRTEPIAVAVEREPQRGAGAPNRRDQVPEVLRHRRVRVVIGKRAVRIAEQRDDVGAGARQRGLGDQTGHAVATVDHHPDRTLHAVARDNGVDVSRQHGVVGLDEPVPRVGRLVLDQPTHLLDPLAVQRLARRHDLEPVERRRVVGTRNLNPAIHVEFVQCQVEGRRREHSDVHRRATRAGDPVPDGTSQHFAGGAVVPSHRDPRWALDLFARERRHRSSDGVRQLRRQLLADDPADVVLPENDAGNLHVRSSGEVVRLAARQAGALTARRRRRCRDSTSTRPAPQGRAPDSATGRTRGGRRW